MTLLHVLSYAGALAAFIFVTLSLASGLLWVSELIEEHSRAAKIIGQRGIYIIIGLHILLYFFDSLPLRHVLFSVLCHVIYLQNFTPTWPLISLTSVTFVASCVLVVVDHFMWFFYFAHLTRQARQRNRSVYSPPGSLSAPGFADIATFFGVCVWLAPLFLFLSLSANDNALPTNSASPKGLTSTIPDVAISSPSHPRGSLFKSIFSIFSFDALKAAKPRNRKNSTQGILAPPSPVTVVPPVTSPLSPSTSLRMASGSGLPPPPPSPNSRRASLETPRKASGGFLAPEVVGWSPSQPPEGFTLSTPPRRDPLSIRRTAAGSNRVELKRTVGGRAAPEERSPQ